MAKRIYFIRHGQSEMNVAGVAAGSSDTPLTDEGHRQAAHSGKRAKESGLSFDIIVSSPLSRAHDTAKAVAQHTDYPIQDIVIRDDLRERHFGAGEGKNIADHFGITREMYFSDPFAFDSIEGAERITDLQYRANQALEELMALPHETILIVSHGALGRSLVRASRNAPLTEVIPAFENAEMFRLL